MTDKTSNRFASLDHRDGAPGPIVVIGSINMDLICRTRAMPGPGETVIGGDFVTMPGGKGANQAVAAAKLSRQRDVVHLIGRVGADDFGDRLLNGLSEHGVRTQRVIVTENAASGVALIVVDRRGENSIVVAPGANALVSPADVDAARALIASASVVMLQLEIPLPTVRHAIRVCRELDVFVILDPAPAPMKSPPREVFAVDLLTPNETEARMLLGETPSAKKSRRRSTDPKQIAGELLAHGAKSVVLKRGSRGSLAVLGAGTFTTARPFKIKVVDTTAAGDAFTGALAVARRDNLTGADALRFANAAGALCCTKMGAQPALPSRDEVEMLLNAKR